MNVDQTQMQMLAQIYNLDAMHHGMMLTSRAKMPSPLKWFKTNYGLKGNKTKVLLQAIALFNKFFGASDHLRKIFANHTPEGHQWNLYLDSEMVLGNNNNMELKLEKKL
jgi:hypothetical protein|tara:strand:+ start:522 stop:848 length:327 start_codon:yes stop_codon:yes gene_type:complete